MKYEEKFTDKYLREQSGAMEMTQYGIIFHLPLALTF